MDLLGREREILRILSVVTAMEAKPILVGGYAVSAHAKHRFSIDCDLVTSKKDLDAIETRLKKEGFQKNKQKALSDQSGAESRGYVKKVGKLPVKVDLLVGALVCRQTGAAWTYDHILANSVPGIVSGVESSVRATIPKRELLMAFKLHAGRDADVRDVVMLGEEADWKKVPSFLMKGDRAKLRTGLEKVLKSLNDTKLVDSLKGEFSLQGNVTPRLDITKRQVGKLLELVKEDAGSESLNESKQPGLKGAYSRRKTARISFEDFEKMTDEVLDD